VAYIEGEGENPVSLISIKRPFEREMEHSITFDASGVGLRPYTKLKKKGN